MKIERSEIVEAFGRTLTVMAYVDAVENGSLPDWSPGAKCGADWFDVTPAGVVASFREASLTALGMIEGFNRKLLEDVLAENFALPEGHLREPTVDSFGHELAMECLGTGCGWGDDHPEHGLVLPSIEVSLYAERHKKSKLLEQATPLEDLFWKRGWELFPEVSGPYYLELRKPLEIQSR